MQTKERLILMSIHWCCFGTIILAFLLAACSLPTSNSPEATSTHPPETDPTPVPVAPVRAIQSPSPIISTIVPIVSVTEKPTGMLQPETTSGVTVEVIKTPCNRAVAGSPIDVTISDGTGMMPGQEFSKTWRLINAGTCTWTTDYALVWFSGPSLAESDKQNFRKPIRPGEIVEISVDMVAPAQPGSYQSNWKISDDHGILFGLGPNGDAPFWVKIEVYPPASSPTPSLEPSSTATPAVFVKGDLTLKPGDGVNLDSDNSLVGEGGSLLFTHDKQNTPVLELNKGVRFGVYGMLPPSPLDCSQVALKTDPIPLDKVADGWYFCYITDQGLPGYAQVGVANLRDDELKFSYLTWAVP